MTLQFKDVDVCLQQIWNANRTVGVQCLVDVLSKYFSVDKPKVFQKELQSYVQLDKLFPDQKQTLFESYNGTDVEKIDFTLLLEILKLTNDPLITEFEKLYKIRQEICMTGVKSMVKNGNLTKMFEEQKILLLSVGAREEDVEHWRSATVDILALEFEKLNNDLTNQKKESKRTKNKQFADLLLPDSLQIVCDSIGDQWRALCKGLTIDKVSLGAIEAVSASSAEKMFKGFEHLHQNVSWSLLKKQLIRAGRDDIIDKIINETCITAGLKELSDALSQRIEDQSDNCAPLNFHYFEDAYLNLAVPEKIDFDVPFTDHEFNLRFRASHLIDLKDVLTERERVVFARGIDYVGKASLIRQMGLQWSKKEILSYVKFFYVLRCRELVNIKHKSLIGMIRREYPDLLESMTDAELIEVAKKTAILIDGFEELSTTERDNLAYLLSKNNYEFNILITSRPRPMTFLHQRMKGKAVKIVDVIGFTESNVNTLLHNWYKDHPQESERISSFKNYLERKSDMKALASLPAHLNTLFYLSDHMNEEEFPETKTELFLLTALVTVRAHKNDPKFINDHIIDVCKNEEVVKIIYLLAKLSYYSLKNEDHIIPAKEIGEYETALIDSGMLFKCRTVTGDAYQFRYLIFTEVLAGLYLFLLHEEGIESFLKIEEESQLWNALPTVVALHSLMEQKQGNEVLRTLITRISKVRSNLQSPMDNLKDNFLKLFSPASLLSSKQMEKVIIKLIGNHSYILFEIGPHPSLLFEVLFEHRSTPPHFFYDFFEKAAIYHLVIEYHFFVKYISRLFHLLDSEKTMVNDLSIETEDGIVTDSEIDMLKHVLVRYKRICLRSKVNFELFIKHVTKPDRTFVNLERLLLESEDLHEESASHLMECVPYLKLFTMSFVRIVSTGSVKVLSSSVVQAYNHNRLALEELQMDNATNKQINTLMLCVWCIENVQVDGIDGSMPCASSTEAHENLTTIDPANSKCRRLVLKDCYLSREALGMFQQLLKNLCYFEISDSEQTSEIISLIKQEMENQEAEMLKSLSFSHLSKEALDDIGTFIHHLEKLSIYQTDIPMEWFHQVKHNLSSKLFQLNLDRKRQSHKNEIMELFTDTTIELNFTI